MQVPGDERPDRWSTVTGTRTGGSAVAVVTYAMGTFPVHPASPPNAPTREARDRTQAAVDGPAAVAEVGDGAPT